MAEMGFKPRWYSHLATATVLLKIEWRDTEVVQVMPRLRSMCRSKMFSPALPSPKLMGLYHIQNHKPRLGTKPLVFYYGELKLGILHGVYVQQPSSSGNHLYRTFHSLHATPIWNRTGFILISCRRTHSTVPREGLEVEYLYVYILYMHMYT
jgi:hypothetical protein